MYDDDLLLQCIQAVNEEIATHIECLADDELFPEHRTHIEAEPGWWLCPWDCR